MVTFRRDFVPHGSDGLRGRTDERESRVFDLLGEFGVLRKEAVSWMDRPAPR